MKQTLTPKQRDVLTLWYQVNASLSAYAKLINAFGSAAQALSSSRSDWQALGLHHTHLSRYDDRRSAEKAISAIEGAMSSEQYQIAFQGQSEFPPQLVQIFDPPPLLFYRGNILRLHEAQIAIVGTRKPTPHAQKITFDLAQYLAQAGYVITSGLAMGVDRQAHLGALTPVESTPAQAEEPSYYGRTVGVMGTGIDVSYPKHHDNLFERIISQGGCLISELLPGTQPNKHTFPRRNRLVAGLSLATIVTEAAVKSGSLITARLTSEQGKQVFAIPSHIDNTNAEGCHHLIREGATLIYHPDQVIEDVKIQSRLPSSSSPNSSFTMNREAVIHMDSRLSTTPKSSDARAGRPAAAVSVKSPPRMAPNIDEVAPHLSALYEQLDWSGQDLDALVAATQLDTPTLLGQLMELELLGVIAQQGGRYLRV